MKKLLKNKPPHKMKNSVKFSPLVAAFALLVTGGIGIRAVTDSFAASNQPATQVTTKSATPGSKGQTAVEASAFTPDKDKASFLNLVKTIGGALLLVTSVSGGISLYRWTRAQYGDTGDSGGSNQASGPPSFTPPTPPLGSPPTQAG
jgi:hypothetical protein